MALTMKIMKKDGVTSALEEAEERIKAQQAELKSKHLHRSIH